MGKRLIERLALLALSLTLSLTQASAAQWATDKASGCRVVDEEAAPDRTVRWNGPCAGGVAEGGGVAEFFAGDSVIRRVEASFSQGVAIGQIKIIRYKNSAISTVTEFARGQGADDLLQKVTFYRDGAVSSIESGHWSGGRLNGSCSVERYAGGRMEKSYSGTCINGAPDGSAKVRFYAISPDHDLLFDGPYHNGKLEGQGESTELLTAVSAAPVESCLRPGDVTLHYAGGWTANAMNGQGIIESHFCAPAADGVIQRIDMKSTGTWLGGVQDGEALAVYVIGGGAPIGIKRLYDHGALVSETLADAPSGKDVIESRESLCRRYPWLCAQRTFEAATFANRLSINRD